MLEHDVLFFVITCRKMVFSSRNDRLSSYYGIIFAIVIHAVNEKKLMYCKNKYYKVLSIPGLAE